MSARETHPTESAPAVKKRRFFRKTIISRDGESPYIVRWIIVDFDWFKVMIHKICRSDYEEALHDHPWSFITFILKSGYVEWFEWHNGEKVRNRTLPFRFYYRPAEYKHRVIIDGEPAWTLVFCGPRVRKWGFWPNDVWCWWRKFNEKLGICEDEPIYLTGED